MKLENRDELIRSLSSWLKGAKYITFVFPGDSSEYISVYGPAYLEDRIPKSWEGYDVRFFEEIQCST